ncbi:hypothetical protein MG293_018691, partial [Ovis ammon polii]
LAICEKALRNHSRPNDEAERSRAEASIVAKSVLEMEQTERFEPKRVTLKFFGHREPSTMEDIIFSKLEILQAHYPRSLEQNERADVEASQVVRLQTMSKREGGELSLHERSWNAHGLGPALDDPEEMWCLLLVRLPKGFAGGSTTGRAPDG